MSLREQLTNAMKIAMKEKQSERLMVIRMVLAKFKDVDIEARTAGKEKADEASFLAAMAKMVKQRQDSVSAYLEGGRQDLADKEKNEIAVIEEFMPQKLNEAEIEAAITTAIQQLEATTIKDMGKVINWLRENYAGQFDMAQVSQKVKAKFS